MREKNFIKEQKVRRPLLIPLMQKKKVYLNQIILCHQDEEFKQLHHWADTLKNKQYNDYADQ